VLVSAVEPSGDLLAGELIEALGRTGGVEAYGVCGPRLLAAGARPLARVEDLSASGLLEILSRLPSIRRISGLLRHAMEESPRPDLLLCVDGPDFNLPLARRARALGIPTAGYVAPQVWAWRPSRARTVGLSYDLLLCLFDFEPPIFEAHGLDARWTGHPAVERVAAYPRRPEPDLFALFPGSRPHELRRHLPIFVEAARRTRQLRPEARFLVGLAPGLDAGALLPDEDFLEPVEGLLPAATRCEAALVAAGTATLELALLDVPMVVACAVSPLTHAVGRLLVRGVRHLALPNLLAGREILPEHVQDLDPGAIARDLLAVAEGPEALLRGLAEVRARVGPPGASARAASVLRERFTRSG
jgi:lipid-A-disaccharide synthase